MAAKTKVFFEAPPEDVFEVLIDYESYPEFIPELTSAKVIEEGRDYIVADFILNAGKTVNYCLRFVPRPYTGIEWTYVRGDLRDSRGSWTLSETPKGTEGIYRVSMDLGLLVPKFVIGAVAGIGLTNVVKRFKDRVESGDAKKGIDLAEEMAYFERQLVKRYLRRAQGDIRRAAELLSVPESELVSKMKTHGLIPT